MKFHLTNINLKLVSDFLAKFRYNVTNDHLLEEEYIEVCACKVDLCNSYVSSSGVASTSETYPPISKITSNENLESGSSSSISYISSNNSSQFNYIFELVNSALM